MANYVCMYVMAFIEIYAIKVSVWTGYNAKCDSAKMFGFASWISNSKCEDTFQNNNYKLNCNKIYWNDSQDINFNLKKLHCFYNLIEICFFKEISIHFNSPAVAY